ncbi:hypothetical protein Misp06_00456 [Microbulbifer sp. NBRC 101763]
MICPLVSLLNLSATQAEASVTQCAGTGMREVLAFVLLGIESSILHFPRLFEDFRHGAVFNR